jgi:D-alanyl-D-alanine dipeptidase
VHDERCVANPKNGSGHNRGIAVDVSIINLKNGQLLNMGTDFDNFTDSAHANFMGLPDSVLANRRLLRQTMQAFGFESLPTEWWHNSWPNAKHFPILNVTFKQLQRMTK